MMKSCPSVWIPCTKINAVLVSIINNEFKDSSVAFQIEVIQPYRFSRIQVKTRLFFNPIYHVSVDHQHKLCYCWTSTLGDAKLPKVLGTQKCFTLFTMWVLIINTNFAAAEPWHFQMQNCPQKEFLLGEILHYKVLGFSSSKVCVDDQHSYGK